MSKLVLDYDDRYCERKTCCFVIPRKRRDSDKDMPWSQYKLKHYCSNECIQIVREKPSVLMRKNSRRNRPVILKPIDYFIMGRTMNG